jgi:dipeptidyl aminopeptidase/acylaminoacyl peptidase
MRAFTPDDIYNVTSLSECDITADGQRVAFVQTRVDRETDGYLSAIWLVPADGSMAPRQFTAGQKRDSSPRWSPDGKWLAFLSERGEEKPQLFVMPADGGEALQLTKLPFGAGVPEWAPDSRRIVFSARTGTPPDPDPKKAKPFRRITSVKYKMNGEGFTYDRRRHLFAVDIRSHDAPMQITDGDWDDTQAAWSPDGSQLAFISAREPICEFENINDIYVVAAGGGEARKVTNTAGSNAAPSFSPEGKTIAHIHTPEWPSNGRLRLVDVDGANFRWVDDAFDLTTGAGALPGAVAKPAWLAGGGILSLCDQRGAKKVIVSTPGAGTRFVGRDSSTISWYSVAADGRTAAIVKGSVTSPGELYTLDIATGAERRLTRYHHTDFAINNAERFVVQTAPGIDIDCWIMKPAALNEGQSYPVLLNVHGGPFGQYGEAFFDEFQVLTAAGYGVVFCNPRGSSGQSTAFARAVVEHMGEPDYHDVMASFEAALTRIPWADQSRLGVIGGSYGGFMTSWIIGHTDRFKAACSERAVNDWYTMQGTSDIGAGFNRNYLGSNATIQGDLQAVLRQSPLTYAKNINTPVLILHSEDDLRCPISQGEQLWVALRQQGKEAEFVRFPDESHELSRSGRPSHRVARFEVILDWFARKL